MRIIVVEDDVWTLRAMQALLESEGHDVHVASSVQQACREFTDWEPQLALLDIDLPDGTGWDVADWIQQTFKSPAPPLVAVTARQAQADVLRAERAGFRAYLLKPIRLAELRIALDGILAGSRA